MSDVVIPIISLCCVAGLYRIPGASCRRSLSSAGWCLVLGLLSLVPKKEKPPTTETRPAKGSFDEIDPEASSAARGLGASPLLCTKLFFLRVVWAARQSTEAPRGVLVARGLHVCEWARVSGRGDPVVVAAIVQQGKS